MNARTAILVVVTGATAAFGWFVGGWRNDEVPPGEASPSPTLPPEAIRLHGSPGVAAPEPATYRAWLTQLKAWAHAAPPSPEQAATLRGTAASVLATNNLKERIAAITEAAIAEALAEAKPGSNPSVAAAAERDFEATIAQILTRSEHRENDLAAAIQTLAARSPEEALAFIQSGRLPEELVASASGALVHTWALTDGRAATEFALSLGWEPIRMQFLLKTWTASDPAAAAVFITANPDAFRIARNGPGYSRWQPDLVACAWYDRDPAAALAWVKAIPEDRLRDSILQKFAPYLGSRDPAAGIALLSDLPPWARQSEVWFGFGENFARRDPAAALAWAQGIEDHVRRDQMVAAALLKMAEQSPEEAAVQIKALPVPLVENKNLDPGFTAACYQIVSHLMAKDPASAEAWVNGLPEIAQTPAHTALYMEAIRTLDPGAAWEYLSAQPDDEALAAVLPQVVAERAKNDPAKALELAAGLPPGQSRYFSVGNAIRELVRFDLPAARAFVESEPPSAERNEAVEAVVHYLGREDPRAAFELASLIPANGEHGDLDRRFDAQVHAIYSAAASDPAVAYALIEQGDYAPDSSKAARLGEIRAEIEKMVALREALRGE